MKRPAIPFLLLVLATAGPALPARADDERGDPRSDCIASYCASDAIYQFAPSAAFAASLFEGPTKFGDVLRLGDFGLGGTSPLEGEVIVVDGTAYHAGPTGALEILSPTARTPFAFVKHFHAERRLELPEIDDFDDLVHALDAKLPSRNVFYAVRIDGAFAYVQLRSVARQERPYPPLAEVVREQNVFEAMQIEGTLVGFRFPAYLTGVNASGWHFHFVDEQRRLGGHVLDVRAGPLTAALDQSRSLTLVLPDDAAFDAADLTRGDDGAAFGAAIRPAPIRSVAPASAAAAPGAAAPATSPAAAPAPSPSPEVDADPDAEADPDR